MKVSSNQGILRLLKNLLRIVCDRRKLQLWLGMGGKRMNYIVFGNKYPLKPFLPQAEISLESNGTNPVALQIVKELYTRSSLSTSILLCFILFFTFTQPAFNELLLHGKHCATY